MGIDIEAAGKYEHGIDRTNIIAMHQFEPPPAVSRSSARTTDFTDQGSMFGSELIWIMGGGRGR
jgi:hypothetical protein